MYWVVYLPYLYPGSRTGGRLAYDSGSAIYRLFALQNPVQIPGKETADIYKSPPMRPEGGRQQKGNVMSAILNLKLARLAGRQSILKAFTRLRFLILRLSQRIETLVLGFQMSRIGVKSPSRFGGIMIRFAYQWWKCLNKCRFGHWVITSDWIVCNGYLCLHYT